MIQTTDSRTCCCCEMGLLLDGLVYHQPTGAICIEDMVNALCPRLFNRDAFTARLRRVVAFEALPGKVTNTRIHCPYGHCQVRLLVHPDYVCGATVVWTSSELQDRLRTLSTREMEVFGLLAEGLSNKQVAARLFLSTRTVEKHRSSLHRKTNTNSLIALVKKWLGY
ncbi:MAG: LuxR C-terminal-related transcriptional regulator [Planctomycetaceae bacterium]